MFDSFAAVSVNRPEGVQLATWDTGATEGSPAPLPTVVILHGLAGSSAEFIRTADELRYRYRVILVDQRGHGRSTRRPEDTSRQAFVDDAIAVIEEVAGGPVTLVGQSMGAHTAMLVAALRPDLVDALVLLEGIAEGVAAADVDALGDYLSSWPVPFANAEDAASFLGKSPLAAAWLADLEETEDGLRPRFDPDVMRATQSAMTARREPEWASVLAPTLVIFADGGLFTDSQKLAFFAARPGTHRVDLVHASHDAHLDAYDQWIAALWDFLLRERED